MLYANLAEVVNHLEVGPGGFMPCGNLPKITCSDAGESTQKYSKKYPELHAPMLVKVPKIAAKGPIYDIFDGHNPACPYLEDLPDEGTNAWRASLGALSVCAVDKVCR
jgi:hypothetical protein